jgi:DNA polymerase III delta prime subunit
VLEEPPESVMFVLIAENKAAFLDTIISRCVVLNVTDEDGKQDSKATLAAEEFLKFLMDNDQYNMLLTTNAFTKKRVDSDNFIKALKTVVSERIKSDPKSHFAKPLLAFYNEIFEYEQQLLTNINLNLFYSNLVCSAIQIIWRNK